MKGSVARPPYHHGGLREAALEVALESLDVRGTLPPLREIAGACGVTHAALYRHFDNLDALALDVAAMSYREMAEEIQRAIDRAGSPVERFRAGCATAIRWGTSHPGRYLFMTSAAFAGQQHHEAFYTAAREAFGSLVEGVTGLGVTEPVPVAHTILCMLHGFVDFTCKGRTVPFGAEGLEAQTERLLEALIGYALSQATTLR